MLKRVDMNLNYAPVMAPVLFFVFMLGPLGFVLYLAVRAFAGRRAEAGG